MKFYLGGYFLLKLQPLKFGTKAGDIVYTCSDCINSNTINNWAYSWTTDNTDETEEAKEKFSLDDNKVISIRTWIDKKQEAGKVGWINVFTDLESVSEYKQTFFPHLDELKVIALYFDEEETRNIIDDFKPQSKEFGEIGLRLNLLRHIEEKEDENELLLGYDFIGVELGGDFHSFHCHDIGTELSTKFGLTLNSSGLFEDNKNWKQVLNYLNNEENGCEPVPWYVTKAKLININA